MLCPHCHPACNGIEHEQCQVSTVRIIQPTLKAKLADIPPTDHFWDVDGVEHSHNPNVIVTKYVCSNGHQFSERSSWECGACGYKACEAEVVA